MRIRIIQGAIEETGEKGIKFTMSDLARRLGMSKRTLYENFSAKEELIDGIVEHFFSEIKKKEETILKDESLDTLEKLKAIAMILPNDPKLMYISRFYEMKRYYPKHWIKVEKWLNDWEPESGLIEEGIKSGRIKKVNSIVFRKMIIESMMALVDRSFLMKNDITLREALHGMVDIILYGLVVGEKEN
ncbi:TetR/AcrR family transcriptional regulator [Marinisporobacter balticus]|uniref:TetR family transcriptional regulator n=1 Tax=Marinisporobacter balticus TaxID=2018667 RepID=A0A4R2L7R1_9FIRM|nr:TetR/AcrR family transcriptional regulator [Marinisporobacter balticus]TCO78718.1 TetR family transcriptional regulator [Marinisporobacter balticus]